MRNQKGITLIALIITIIVMLILVAVTVSVALNGGVFDNAKNASDKTQRQAEKEELIGAMVGAYTIGGNFATSNVGDLPGGAKWCNEDTEVWSENLNVNPTGKGDWIITPNNNKFYVDSSGSVLDKRPNNNANSNSIYDVAYIYDDGETDNRMYIIKNNGKIYYWRYDEGTLIENCYMLYSIGSKIDYETEIKEDWIDDEDFETEVRDEVIITEDELSYIFKKNNNQEVLNDGKKDYIRDDSYDISSINFDSIPLDD